MLQQPMRKVLFDQSRQKSACEQFCQVIGSNMLIYHIDKSNDDNIQQKTA